MIDIIIPCYNSHKTIDRCLASIVTQNKECTVTLVNDGGENYSDIIKRYPLNIREIGYNENKGVGYARIHFFLISSITAVENEYIPVEDENGNY